MKPQRSRNLHLLRLALTMALLFSTGLVANGWAAESEGAYGENEPALRAGAPLGGAPLISVNPQSGSPSATIPFELNVARGAIQPTLALHYAADVDGEAGKGWSLMIPSVERKPLSGLPNYANDPGSSASSLAQTDRMAFGGDALVPLCIVGFANPQCAATPTEKFPGWSQGWYYFRLAADTSFDRFFWSPNKQTWRVESRDGSVAEYGVPTIEPSYSEAIDKEGAYPFRWNLVRRWDAHGEWTNTILYRWAHLGALGRGYLTDIFDTPREIQDVLTDTATWAHHVRLDYDKAPYEVSNGGNPLFGEREYHLRTVSVTSASAGATGAREIVRSYRFDYSKYSHHEYLATVTPFARPEDGSHQSTCVEGPNSSVPVGCSARSLPATTISYTRFALGQPPSAANYFSSGGGALAAAVAPFPQDLTPIKSSDSGQYLLAASAKRDWGGHYPYCVDANGHEIGDQTDCFGSAYSFDGPSATILNPHQLKIEYQSSQASSASNAAVLNPAYVNIIGDWDATGGTGLVFQIEPDGSPESVRFALGHVQSGTSNYYHFDETRWSRFQWFGPPITPDLYFADVNADGLLDMVGSSLMSLTSRRTDGRIVPFVDTQPTSGVVQPAPGTNQYVLIDMNGDGLEDSAYAEFYDDGARAVYRPGDGRGHFSIPQTVTMGVGHIFTVDRGTFGGTRLKLHDVNGDGLADIVYTGEFLGNDAIQVLFNDDGHSFRDVSINDIIYPGLYLNGVHQPAKKVMFLDALGWGVEGIAVLGPQQISYSSGAGVGLMRPGLLESIDNGRGLKATVSYEHLTDLERKGLSTGGTSVPMDVVKSVELAAYNQTFSTRYRYDDPVYDGWRRQLRGFRHVREEHSVNGDAYRTLVDTTYEIDASGPAVPSRDDDALELIAPLPRLREVFGHAEGTSDQYGPLPASTVYLSTTTTGYSKIIDYAVGVDGRRVRFVFPETVDTYLYDTAPFVHVDSTQTVEVIAGAPKYQWNADLVVTSVDYYPINSVVTLRSNQFTHLKRTVERDASRDFSVTKTVDYGVLGVDQPIATQYTYGLVPGTARVWRAYNIKTSAFMEPSNEVGDWEREFDYSYFDDTGELKVVTGHLQGTLDVERRHENPNRAIQTSVPGRSTDGPVVLASYTYDEFGNVTRVATAGGQCADSRYDDEFHQFPTASIDYVNGCGNQGITTLEHFRREFGASDMTIAPSGAISRVELDDLGRAFRVYDPDPNALGGTVVALTMAYDDGAKAYTDLQRTHAYSASGEKWTFTDGLGRVVAAVDRADPAAGDGGGWLVSGVQERLSSGVSVTYEPWFATFDPSTAFPTTPPQQKFVRQTTDVFGRAIGAFAQDGVQVARSKYHALSVESLDEGGVPSWVEHDGHGRTIRQSRREGADTAVTEMSYLVGGEVRMVRRTHSAGPSENISRWMQYDSLGRMVANVEPNSVVSFSADPKSTTVKKWIYAHDDAGRVVGTSDPRGCGTNLVHDGAGRLTKEDYSPCKESQPLYTVPGLGDDGYETVYRYDDPESSQTPGPLAQGRLVSLSDRGSHSRFEYDARGRTVRTQRQIARLDGASLPIVNRYTPHYFSRDIAYDSSNRPISMGTGADVDALKSAGQSAVSMTYSQRGLVSHIDSSYGPLLASSIADELGSPTLQVLGDGANTRATYSYDLRRRPYEFVVDRTVPSGWSSASGTQMGQLEHAVIGFDTSGNLSSIFDRRPASEWPAGAKPVDRTMTYDEAHRLKQVSYVYANGTDSQVSPFASEEAASDPRPVPQRTNLGQRVASQSFDYDWRGNLTSSEDNQGARFDRSLGAIVYDTTAQNRVVSAANGAIRSDFDDAGNLVNLVVERSGMCSAPTGKCVQRYVYDWDELGQLARARRWDYATLPSTNPYPALPSESPTIDLSYEYSQGARVRKTSGQGTGALHSIYVFDSLQLDDAGIDSATGDYLRGDQGGAITESLYLAGIGHVVYSDDDPPANASGHLRILIEIGDHLGSANVLIDRETGELVEKVSYQAYGAVDADYRPARWGSFREKRRLTGTEDDYEVGLSYFGGRYYSPNLAHWISPDPLTIHGLGADLNPYAYVGGSPMQAVDIGGFGSDGCDNLSPGCMNGIDVPGLVGGLIDWLGGVGSNAGSAAKDTAARHADIVNFAARTAQAAVRNPSNVNWGRVSREVVRNQKAFVVSYAKANWRGGVAMVVQTKDRGEGYGCTHPACHFLSNRLKGFEQLVAPPKANAPPGAKFGDYFGGMAIQAATMVATAGIGEGPPSGGAGATTTFFRGMTYGEALEAVEGQALSSERIAANQALNPGAAGSGAYMTTQEETARFYAKLVGDSGRGMGPSVVRIDVPTAQFEAFALRNGIAVETPIPRGPFRGATETLIPLSQLAEFNAMCTFCIHF